MISFKFLYYRLIHINQSNIVKRKIEAKFVNKYLYENHNFAYLGSKSGVNFIAIDIFPLIFIFPYIKAYYGLSFPSAILIKS
jgi:hypothetical protein